MVFIVCHLGKTLPVNLSSWFSQQDMDGEFIKFLFFQVMLDTVGPELQVVNKSEKSISLQADAFVVLTPDQEKEASSELLPINFDGLSKVLAYSQNVSDI